MYKKRHKNKGDLRSASEIYLQSICYCFAPAPAMYYKSNSNEYLSIWQVSNFRIKHKI